MTICGTAAVQTDTQKTFLFEKKSFSFDFLYCYVRVVQNSKNGAKSIIEANWDFGIRPCGKI